MKTLIILAIIIAAFALLSYCRSGKVAEVTAVCKDDDALDMAVYRKLVPQFSEFGSYGHINDLSIWLSGNYDTSYWNPILDGYQKRIDDIREWTKTVEDPCIRKHYNGWLTYYYQVGIDDARKELKTRSIKREHEKSDEEYRQREKYRQEREKTNPIPEFKR